MDRADDYHPLPVQHSQSAWAQLDGCYRHGDTDCSQRRRGRCKGRRNDDLLVDAKLRTAAKDYFTNVQTKDQKYLPMIGAADKPAIEINADIMARYKPELSKYYYDPSRYPTYLDQLGIKFPMLEEPASTGEVK